MKSNTSRNGYSRHSKQKPFIKNLIKAHKEIDRLRDTNQHITSELEVTRRNVQNRL